MAGKTTVIHVDDNEDVRVLVRMSLEVDPGIEVVQFTSGLEALYNATSYQPDVLLLDVMMPDMSGTELLERFRTIPGYASTPVVFLTAKATKSELDELRELQVSRIITKPFDALTLAEEIRGVRDSHESQLAG